MGFPVDDVKPKIPKNSVAAFRDGRAVDRDAGNNMAGRELVDVVMFW